MTAPIHRPEPETVLAELRQREQRRASLFNEALAVIEGRKKA